MGILKEIRDQSNEKVIIPEVGLLKIKLKKKQWGIAYYMDRCYIEADSYDDILYYLAYMCKLDGVIPVGEVNKVSTGARKRKERVVYRQRFVFDDLMTLCIHTKRLGLNFVLSDAFNVRIDGIIEVVKELEPLFKHARKNGLNVDNYLKDMCLAQFLTFLYDCGYVELETLITKYRNSVGLLDKAPYLVIRGEDSVDEGASDVDVFMPKKTLPVQLYSKEIDLKKILTYGYNSLNIKGL